MSDSEMLLKAVRIARDALVDPYCGEDDGLREAPVIDALDAVIDHFKPCEEMAPVNLARAELARRALGYVMLLNSASRDSYPDAIVDLLADLLHLADEFDFDVDILVETARHHFFEEKRESAQGEAPASR